MLSLEEIVGKVVEQAGLSREDVLEKVREKVIELSGLVSEEGAAYLVARESGIDLLKRVVRRLEIGNVTPGMRTVEITGRIYRIFPPKEFERNGKKGSVASMIVWDPTGTVRLTLWNDETKLIEKNGLKEGQVVEISGYSHEDNRGGPELRLGNRGKIEIKNVDFPEIAARADSDANLSDVRVGGRCRVRATLVQLFESNPFYEVCPKCGVRVKESEGKFFCNEHQWVEPAHKMVVSGVVDDGTGNMRIVFFGELAEKIIGMTTEDSLRMAREKMNKTAPIAASIDGAVGRDFVVSGRVRRNDVFERNEIIAEDIADVNVNEEIEKLIGQLQQVTI